MSQKANAILKSAPVSEADFIPSPPSTLYADEADEALAVSRYQQELLDRAEHLLKRMRLLAAIGHEAENPDHNLLNREFRDLLGALTELLVLELNGVPVFRKKDRAVDLQQSRNKLVLPGVYALKKFLPRVSDASLLGPGSCGSALKTIRTALDHVAMDQAMSMENVTRLTFLTRHFEEIKETL